MIVRIFLSLIIFALSLFANDISMQIDRLNKRVPYATKHQTVEILHQFENLYISSVISKDRENIVKSLRGIIRCRKLLNMDSKSYERELYSLTKREIRKNVKKRTKPKPSSAPATLKKKPNSYKSSVPTIKSIYTKENTLIIKFASPIKKSDVFYFKTLTEEGYKSIYDIKANLKGNFTNLKIPLLERIKVAQNRQDRVRVVLQDRDMIYTKAFIRKGNLFIMVNKSKNKTKTATRSTPEHKPKKIVLKKSETKAKKSEKKGVDKDKKIKITSEPIAKSKTDQNPLYADSKVIVIDAGHGGHDAGAIGYKKHQEKRAVLKVAKLLKKMLVEKGYRVFMTREGDQFVKLKDRTSLANRKKADLFISIHANAAPKGKHLSLKGIETFFLSPARSERAKRVAAKENSAASALNRHSKNTLLNFLNRNKIIQSNKLAIDIQSGMLTEVRKKFRSVKDGGVREAPFWVLVGAQMPAVLIEIGYITNPMEGDRLYNPFYQKALAKGIYKGINNYFANNR
jgi:N-acetylmuramoyl-L-alanine amidase